MLTTHVTVRKNPSEELLGHLKLDLNWAFN